MDRFKIAKRKLNDVIWKFYATFYDCGTRNAVPYRELVSLVLKKIRVYKTTQGLEFFKLLDACCGTGNFSAAIQSEFLGSSILGVDFTPQMIARARKKSQAAIFNVEKIQTFLDRQNPSTFDIVLMVNGFYPLQDHEEVLKCFSKILKPGGMLILTDPRKGAKLTALATDHFRRGTWFDWIIAPLTFGALAMSVLLQYGARMPFWDENDLIKLLEKYSFEIEPPRYSYANQNYFLTAFRRRTN